MAAEASSSDAAVSQAGAQPVKAGVPEPLPATQQPQTGESTSSKQMGAKCRAPHGKEVTPGRCDAAGLETQHAYTNLPHYGTRHEDAEMD